MGSLLFDNQHERQRDQILAVRHQIMKQAPCHECVGVWCLVFGGWCLMLGGWWLVVGGWFLVSGSAASGRGTDTLRLSRDHVMKWTIEIHNCPYQHVSHSFSTTSANGSAAKHSPCGITSWKEQRTPSVSCFGWGLVVGCWCLVFGGEGLFWGVSACAKTYCPCGIRSWNINHAVGVWELGSGVWGLGSVV